MLILEAGPATLPDLFQKNLTFKFKFNSLAFNHCRNLAPY